MLRLLTYGLVAFGAWFIYQDASEYFGMETFDKALAEDVQHKVEARKAKAAAEQYSQQLKQQAAADCQATKTCTQ